MPGNIAVGALAPDFSLQDADSTLVVLSDLRGAPVVLIFYPKDETPGCTAQLCAARDDQPLYAEAGATVLAINSGSAKSHRSFRDKHKLSARLLVDTDLKVARDYDSVIGFGPLSIVRRTVFVINSGGYIQFMKRGTPSTDSIVEAIKSPVKR